MMVVHDVIERDLLDSINGILIYKIDTLNRRLEIKDTLINLQRVLIQNNDTINTNLREKIDITNSIAQSHEERGKAYKRQRNIAVVVGLIFIVIAIIK